MAKIKTVKKYDFKTGEFYQDQTNNDFILTKVLTATGPALIMIVPKTVGAAAVDSTFGNVHGAIMNLFDAGVVLVIIFAGASWGLGHRTKAIEIIIGVCCGYLLARHAVDIRDFLKSI